MLRKGRTATELALIDATFGFDSTTGDGAADEPGAGSIAVGGSSVTLP